MNSIPLTALLALPLALGATPSTPAFDDTAPALPPLSLKESLARGPAAVLEEKGVPMPRRGPPADLLPQRLPLRERHHFLRMIRPEDAYRYTIIVQEPDPSVNHSMLTRELPPARDEQP